MTFGAWGAPDWAPTALALAAIAAAAAAWSYGRSDASRGVRAAAAALKAVALALVALALVDPLLSGVRPRRGANIFAIVADDSQSMQIHDAGAADSRGEQLQRMLLAESPWQTRLGTDFDVRRLAFSTQLRAVDDFSALEFEGVGTSLEATLQSLARRFRGLPVAGVLLLTDGNATDALGEDVPWAELPPIFPAAIGDGDALRDVSVERVSASETNFESAPVTIRADVRSIGGDGQPIVVALYDEDCNVVEKQTARPDADGVVAAVRFQFRPERSGVSFYSVGACEECDPEEADAEDRKVDEATLANNRRLVAIDRGGGPYRVLYVSGRPNWDFKFLRRAVEEDDQIELVGLIRIAKKQPKFSFRRQGERTNELFEGFEHPDDDAAETYDEPVLVRLGTEDDQGEELKGGFPRTADELYRYDALVLDDLEAAFFTQDQLTLIEGFVSRRGGGLLMLGGAESFLGGGYRRTPAADALPVYVDGASGDSPPADGQFRLSLKREGWLEPWVRLRKTEPEDRQRLAAMPPFETLNSAGLIKPGATVLEVAIDGAGREHPALVVQRYGRGRSAAMLLGDLWRWGLARRDENDDDLGKSWRQTVRWLVGDVPQRVEVDVQAGGPAAAAGAVTVLVRVRDAEYLPLDNAEVTIRITTPDDREIELEAEPSAHEAGAYAATHVPRVPGAYRAKIEATAPDGSAVGERETGWASQPLADEFNRLTPNRDLLAEIATKTGGEVLEAGDLDDFVATLDSRSAPITEPWTRPLWHHPLYFLAIVGCLAGEWGLRRWKGLA